MKKPYPLLVSTLALSGALLLAACGDKEQKVTINLISAEGIGEAIGTISLKDSSAGLVLTPDLTRLSPGEHGFHVHQNGDCGPGEKEGAMQAGLAAGGHFDPHGTGMHMGPASDEGHQGDLPVLLVNPDGTATTPVTAPHLKLADIKGKALMIHAGGDNYADEPAPLGGGGARVACGVI